ITTRPPPYRHRSQAVKAAKRAPDLARGEQRQPVEDERLLLHAGIAGGEKLERVRRISGLAVERGGAGLQVAPHPRSRAAPVRVDTSDAVEDLTGARLALRASDRPAALGPADPLHARIPRVS